MSIEHKKNRKRWNAEQRERKRQAGYERRMQKNPFLGISWLRRKCYGNKRLAFAKEDSGAMQHFAHRMLIKVTPSSIADYHGCNLPVGIQYRFYRSFAFSAEIAIPMPFNLDFSLSNNNVKGKTILTDFKLRSDLRKYFYRQCNHQAFLGIEAFWRQQHFTQSHSYYDGGSYVYSYSWANAEKESWGVGGLLGVSSQIGKALNIEFYIGIGVKNLNLRFTEVQNLNRTGNSSGSSSYFFSDEDAYLGHIWRPYFPIGIKIGYLINAATRNRHKIQ